MTRLLITALSTGAGVGLISTVIPVSIWPGEAKLTAPLFCSAPWTEPHVVSDTWHDSEGTSVNYTLYCVGERGSYTDEGFVLPMLVLFAAHVLLVTTLVLLVGLWTRMRATSPMEDAPPIAEISRDAVEY